ncbi:hypothetical protein ACN28S_41970 [Cystobacter fuscus]
MSSTVVNPLQSTNSMTPNGLIMNGLIMNGLSTNGLIMNGLMTSGLSTATFSDWFNANPEGYSSMVMKYVVGCAVPSGQSRTWTNPLTNVSYTWNGVLGLTPDWASGLPATEREQQLLTACLAAHVNKYGLHVLISVQGLNAKDVPLPGRPTSSRRSPCWRGLLRKPGRGGLRVCLPGLHPEFRGE